MIPPKLSPGQRVRLMIKAYNARLGQLDRQLTMLTNLDADAGTLSVEACVR